MKPRKLICKVEKIVREEVSKDFSEYCGDDFSIGPVLVKNDYQAFREMAPCEKYILISVVYEADLSNAPLLWENEVFRRVWAKLGEEGIEAYPFFDYVKKSRWESGDWQQRRGWEW